MLTDFSITNILLRLSKVVAAAFLLLPSNVCYSQFSIQGKVSSAHNEKLEFVGVALLKDSVIIKTTYTDSLGVYVISNIPPNFYHLSFYALGYASLEINALIKQDTTIHITLSEKSTLLNEVVIQSKTGTLERKADRFVYSIAHSEVTKGNTVYEVLKQTPLVQVNEATGGITLINNSAVVIYINGKRSRLSQEAIANLLKSNNADNLSNIEIITVPGSNYEVEGKAGILNIVMKKNQTEGFNGNVRVADVQTHFNTQTFSTNLNYRKNKIGVNVNLYKNAFNKLNTYDIDFLFKESNMLQTIRTKDEQPQTFFGTSLGIDYDINDKHALGFKVDGMLSSQKNTNSTSISQFKSNGACVYDSIQQTINIGNRDMSTININGNYHYAIDSTGGFFNVDVDYMLYSNVKTNVSETNLINQDLNILSQRGKFKQYVPQNIENISSKIEYMHAFNEKNSLTIGINSSLTNTHNDTYFGNFTGGDYQEDPLKSFNYSYHESIYALFTTYNKTWNEKWQSSLGLRLENTKNNGTVIETNQHFKNNYSTLLPYIAVSYSPSQKNQFSYTFSNRIERPAFWELNPFRYYTTSNFYIENNPFLQPQRFYINELSYTLNSKYTFFVNYSHIEQAYAQLQLADENNAVKMLRLNYGTNEDVNAGLSVQQTFFKEHLQTNLSMSGGATKYKGKAEYVNIDNIGYYFNSSLNNTITLSKSKKWFGFVNMTYNSPTKYLYGCLKSINKISVGMKKRYNNWTFFMWLNDILKGSQQRYSTEDNKIFSEGISYYDERSLYVSVTYNFGNDMLKRTRERETSNTDIKNRTQR